MLNAELLAERIVEFFMPKENLGSTLIPVCKDCEAEVGSCMGCFNDYVYDIKEIIESHLTSKEEPC